jgi:hypothetical protein
MKISKVKSFRGFHGLLFLILRTVSSVFGGGQGSNTRQATDSGQSDKQDTFVYSMY